MKVSELLSSFGKYKEETEKLIRQKARLERRINVRLVKQAEMLEEIERRTKEEIKAMKSIK